MSRSELERADWTVEVPAAAQERLDLAGHERPGR
jgi:hypothetical protein